MCVYVSVLYRLNLPLRTHWKLIYWKIAVIIRDAVSLPFHFILFRHHPWSIHAMVHAMHSIPCFFFRFFCPIYMHHQKLIRWRCCCGTNFKCIKMTIKRIERTEIPGWIECLRKILGIDATMRDHTCEKCFMHLKRFILYAIWVNAIFSVIEMNCDY